MPPLPPPCLPPLEGARVMKAHPTVPCSPAQHSLVIATAGSVSQTWARSLLSPLRMRRWTVPGPADGGRPVNPSFPPQTSGCPPIAPVLGGADLAPATHLLLLDPVPISPRERRAPLAP